MVRRENDTHNVIITGIKLAVSTAEWLNAINFGRTRQSFQILRKRQISKDEIQNCKYLDCMILALH